MKNIAFITGIGGQDGSYLAELLISMDYKVYGIVRRNSILFNSKNIENIREKVVLNYGDVNDALCIHRILTNIINENRDFDRFEMYNLAAQSHVAISFDTPDYTTQTNINGALYILEFIRQQPESLKMKMYFYQASTSEMFGEILENPQTELTPFNPLSPYACAKLNAHFLTKCYRNSYNIFACNGILFNHESPRRGNNFVTKKIVLGLKKYIQIKDSLTKTSDAPLILGNINSYRDWGHAKDYVYGMWKMLNHNVPDDYILSTNIKIKVKEFVDIVASKLGIKLKWYNESDELDIRAYDVNNDYLVVRTDEKYFRKNDVVELCGDSTKARTILGWTPNYNLNKLIDDMIKS